MFAVDDFWNMGKSGRITMLAQLSPIAGKSPSREAPPSGQRVQNAGLPERKEKENSIICGWEELGSTERILYRRVVVRRDLVE